MNNYMYLSYNVSESHSLHRIAPNATLYIHTSRMGAGPKYYSRQDRLGQLIGQAPFTPPNFK